MTDETRNRWTVIAQGLAAVATFVLGVTGGRVSLEAEDDAAASSRAETVEIVQAVMRSELRDSIEPVRVEVARLGGAVDALSHRVGRGEGRLAVLEALPPAEAPTPTAVRR